MVVIYHDVLVELAEVLGADRAPATLPEVDLRVLVERDAVPRGAAGYLGYSNLTMLVSCQSG
jgi:hypothetical protein